jgi:hypothetical protein
MNSYNELNDYRNQIQKLEIENQEQQQQLHDTSRSVNSIFQSPENENIIQWQLDLQEQLDNIGHSLRGHVILPDENGVPCWQEPTDKSNVIFTEYGVQEILRYLLQYLNKNTILSNYDEKTIEFKVYDAGYALVDLVFVRYEKFFYLTPAEDLIKDNWDITIGEVEDIQRDERKEKMKHFETSIKPVIDAIHSAFLRALNGGERNSLRSARLLTQTENPTNMMPSMQMQQKRKLLSPTTWFK